jgi:hypothetical protein
MPNSNIFCNIPWFEININHDGSYDLCGCQNDKLVGTELGQIYNIKKISIDQYWNSERLQTARLKKLGDRPDPMCRMCQQKEAVGYESNRIKENLKSVIFQKEFDRSYYQSPNVHHFEYSKNNQGHTQTKVHSLHVNLGDTCNFACRMCNPYASTRLQTEFKQLTWMARDQRLVHWTDDAQGWNNFVEFLINHGEQIKVLHIIGGEPALLPKFEFLINYFIEKDLAKNVNISFTTNGSYTYSEYFTQLSKYKRAEIGISIEAVSAIGDYIRQGGDINNILKNIQWINSNKSNNVQLVLRTVPSLLSLPSYHELILWAFETGIPIDNSLLVNPAWQQTSLLPIDIREKIIQNISKILEKLPNNAGEFNNQKDANKIAISIRNECESIINIAQLPEPPNADLLKKECAVKLSQWDQLKNINLKNYSIDLYNFLNKYGYQGA